jgi:polar amino acid transport system substrate-binding protein
LDWDGNQQLVIIGEEIAKKVRIATEPTYTPFEFTKDRQLQGFDMDIIHAIANQQGMDINIYYLGFDALIPALRAGKADAVISAVAITEPRKEVVAFSEPYFTEGLCMVTKNDNHVIQKIDDLTGKIIGVEVGTIGNEYANKLKERNSSTNVVCFESPMSMFTQLEIGTLDAVLNYRSLSSYYIKCNEGSNLKIAGLVNPNVKQYGIMVRLEDEQLLAQINSGLQKIQDSGQYDSIYRKWFGNDGVVERE